MRGAKSEFVIYPWMIRLLCLCSDASRPSFASQVNIAVSQVPSLPDVPDQEDNDEWLNIDVQDFDETLEKTMGTSKAKAHKFPDGMDVDDEKTNAEDRLGSAQAAKLKELAAKVEKFVEGEGDIEGARFEE